MDSKPSTASPPKTQQLSARYQAVPGSQQKNSEAVLAKSQSRSNETGSRLNWHRSVPPVHELTSHNIGYKANNTITRYQRSAPAPTNMTYLPSAQEKLLVNRKFLAKIVGFDATTFDQQEKQPNHRQSPSSRLLQEVDENIARYNNAFSSGRSPRGLRSSLAKDIELSKSEIIKGHYLPATPRLLRRGDSKTYGIRRQISLNNQLELSPDFPPETPARKSAVHFNTPAGRHSLDMPKEAEESDPMNFNELEKKNRGQTEELYRASNHVSPFGDDGIDTTAVALTNRLVLRDRHKDAPWVYCYKIKRDSLKLSQLLTNKSVTDPAVDELLPAF